MSNISQIKEKLNEIDKKISKRKYLKESFKRESEDVTKQIYKAVDEADSKDRE